MVKIAKQCEDRLIRICWEKKKTLGEKETYSEERTKFYRGLGYNILAIEQKKAAEENFQAETIRRLKDIEEQEAWVKIRESRYNRRYKDIFVDRLPEYLRDRKRGKDSYIMAKLRCGNYEENNKYWKNEEDRKCKLCKVEMGTMEHLIEECVETTEERKILGEKKNIKYILNERGYKEIVTFFRNIEKKLKVENKKISNYCDNNEENL